MGADKARAVRETGAEAVCTVDNSCLMHIGGTLRRQGAAVRPVHIAEILAATEADAREPSRARATEGSPR